MTKASDDYRPERPIDELLSKVLDSSLDEREYALLDELLSNDPAARQLYREHIALHALLHWMEKEEGKKDDADVLVIDDEAVSASVNWHWELPPEKPRPKVVIETSPPTPIPWYSVNSPIGLPLIANTISAILMLIGLGIASVVYVNHNYEIAATQAATSEEDSGGSGSGGLPGALATAEKAKPKKEETPVVGYISGMADCRWTDPSFKPIAPRIRQGAKFALESGLMEITYTTGAKVILQGPCTYEVESPHGGFLALGKLTARVASGQWPVASAESHAANHKSAIRNHKSAISKSPNLQISKFAVRTPTAIITDLGTEFGVEVFDTGETISHVFDGMVRVAVIDAGNNLEGKTTILRAEQSARVERCEKGPARLVLNLKSERAVDFVRRMPEVRRDLVAWFRLGDDDPEAAAGKPFGAETVDRQAGERLIRYGNPLYSDDVPPVGSVKSVRFFGTVGEYYSMPKVYAIRNNFVLEAWVKPRSIAEHPQLIVYNGHPNESGFGLLVMDGRWQFMFGGIEFGDSGVKCEIGKWTHLALVSEWGKSRLWINGEPRGEPVSGLPYPPGVAFAIGGNIHNPPQTFDGEVDEVRLWKLFQPFSPEMLLLSPPQENINGKRQSYETLSSAAVKEG